MITQDEKEKLEIIERRDLVDTMFFGDGFVEDLITKLQVFVDECKSQEGWDLRYEADCSYGYYDSIDREFTITWRRFETDEERDVRVEELLEYERKKRADAKKRKAQKEERDRKEYERLKAKYDG